MGVVYIPVASIYDLTKIMSEISSSTIELFKNEPSNKRTYVDTSN